MHAVKVRWCLEIAGRAAVRDLPQDLSHGQIDCGDPAIRRFDERKVTDGRDTRTTGDVVAHAGPVSAVSQSEQRRGRTRRYKKDTQPGIHRATRPIDATTRAGEREGPLIDARLNQGRRSIERPEPVILYDPQCFGPKLRSKVDEVILSHALSFKRRRLGGKRLRG